jgi:hypothetical protein
LNGRDQIVTLFENRDGHSNRYPDGCPPLADTDTTV